MSDLRAQQLQVAQTMLAPTAASPDAWRGDALADAASRFNVYHRGYRLRLIEALRTEFPGLALMAGKRFSALVADYVAAHPSTHFNIRWHGRALAAFLAEATPWRMHAGLAQVAQLDWAISTAFDAADESPLGVADLASVPPEGWAGLRLQPLRHLRLISCTANVDAFRRASDSSRARPHLRRLGLPRHLMVWRPAQDVRYRAVSGDEWPILQGMLQGEPFAQLCERMAQRRTAANMSARIATLLAHWAGEGVIGGMTTM